MNCGSSCPAQWQSGWNSAKWVEGTKRFPGTEWLLLEALRVASQDVAEDVTKKRLSTTFFRSSLSCRSCQRERTRILFTENWIQLSRIVAWCGSQLLGLTVEQLLGQCSSSSSRRGRHLVRFSDPGFNWRLYPGGINIIGGQWGVTKAGGRGRTKGSSEFIGIDFRRRRPRPDNQDGRRIIQLASTPGHN